MIVTVSDKRYAAARMNSCLSWRVAMAGDELVGLGMVRRQLLRRGALKSTDATSRHELIWGDYFLLEALLELG